MYKYLHKGDDDDDDDDDNDDDDDDNNNNNNNSVEGKGVLIYISTCPEREWSTVNDNNNITLSKTFRTVGMAHCTFITSSLRLQAGFLYLTRLLSV